MGEATDNLSDSPGASRFASIAVSGETVYVAWDDSSLGSGSDIFYRRSVDGGIVFSDIENLSNTAFSGSIRPEIATSGDEVHIAWQEGVPSDIFYLRSLDGGITFSGPAMNLSNNAGSSEWPGIAVLDNHVYVVWADSTDANFEILYRSSMDSGTTFDDILSNLSTNPGTSFGPVIAVS